MKYSQDILKIIAHKIAFDKRCLHGCGHHSEYLLQSIQERYEQKDSLFGAKEKEL